MCKFHLGHPPSSKCNPASFAIFAGESSDFHFADGVSPRSTYNLTGALLRLFVGADGAFVLRTDLVSIPPLPVVVAVIVDLLDCDRRL